MSIGSALYKLFIGPLELLFEVIYAIAYRLINNPGLSIIFLSLAMNFLVLPLYRQADAMQAAERDREASLQPWIHHIRKTFKGDERFMILQTYYRQNNYKPTQALNGSFSLLLEIPFFIAAYRFLSSLQLLQGVSFGPIIDLGSPDALLHLRGISINVLPILMTLINLISAAIYMKGFPLKSKIQMYGMALIFLVFLYDSPSGLVFYWTLNNIFSLLKNIFYKMKHPRLVLSFLSSILGITLAVFIMLHPFETTRRQLFVFVFCVFLQIPLFLHIVGNRIHFSFASDSKSNRHLFLLSCIFLTIMTGMLIPSAVIRSSPLEFIDISAYQSPLWYILSSFLLAAGTFLIWFGIFYHLADDRGKYWLSGILFFLSVAAGVDYLFFGTDYGTLSDTLVYEVLPQVSRVDMLGNILVLFCIAAFLYVIWRKKRLIAHVITISMCLAAFFMSLPNTINIQKSILDSRDLIAAATKDQPTITLSKNNKNVIVLMMDRAFNGFFPFLLEEKPELQSQFEGFTYYPNTISYGNYTNVGAPAVFGGYEYTPIEIDKRSDEILVDKHNEALKVMPVIFSENGYDVTVCDPSYAGYQWIPDLSIYDDYPDIHTYITDGNIPYDSSKNTTLEDLRARNFFCYSIFKISPLVVQKSLYNNGTYNALPRLRDNPESLVISSQEIQDLSHATGINKSFVTAYSVLVHLSDITSIEKDAPSTFTMMSNNTTHEPRLLQEPDYVPANVVDNQEYDNSHAIRYSIDGKSISLSNSNQTIHYHTNMAAMLQLGKWFDFLRKNNVYDNTRIIIVADHGRDLGLFDMKIGDSRFDDLNFFYPLLLFKDFNSRDFSVDTQFMTNADTPSLAFEGLIEKPVNPFTGNYISSQAKNASPQYLASTTDWHTTSNNGTTFADITWFSNDNDVLDISKWKKLESHP